ncbi:hypothetical protein ACTFIV_002390 [Dictyostelium citrinum]
MNTNCQSIENFFKPSKVPIYVKNNQIELSSSNSNIVDLENPNLDYTETYIGNLENSNLKSNIILINFKKYLTFILIFILFLFLLISRSQLLKKLEYQKIQYDQLLKNQTYIQKQNQEQIQSILSKIQSNQQLFDQYETDFKINLLINKKIDIQEIDQDLYIRTDGYILNLAKFSNEWEKFIIEQSKIPGRYLIKSNQFKTYLFYNNNTNIFTMNQLTIESECSTFKFIKTNINDKVNDQYQIETCLGFLIKTKSNSTITTTKNNDQNNKIGTNFILNSM